MKEENIKTFTDLKNAMIRERDEAMEEGNDLLRSGNAGPEFRAVAMRYHALASAVGYHPRYGGKR